MCHAGDAVELAAALARQPQTGGAGVVRPPAIVVEYMGQGSLKGALARKADIVQGALIRVMIAMDAAKVTVLLCSVLLSLSDHFCCKAGQGMPVGEGTSDIKQNWYQAEQHRCIWG